MLLGDSLLHQFVQNLLQLGRGYVTRDIYDMEGWNKYSYIWN